MFKDFSYQTEKTWSRPRRVVGKAEHLPPLNDPPLKDRCGPIRGSSSPPWPATRIDARSLYEDLYCARGEMENRIKEQQLDLFADRTSSATMKANQLRLWFSSMAYVLVNELRRIALRHSQFADATCGTIRLKLLKSAPWSAAASGGSSSPWPRAFPGRTSSRSPMSICNAPSRDSRARLAAPDPTGRDATRAGAPAATPMTRHPPQRNRHTRSIATPDHLKLTQTPPPPPLIGSI